jgi:transcriptional regulator GlxA family with amidase domain
MTPKVLFYIHDQVHLLDLAGAVQVFYESGNYGHPYDLHFVSRLPDQTCSSKLRLFALEDYRAFSPGPEDILIVPGYSTQAASAEGLPAVYAWLRESEARGAVLCSVCTGSFLLAEAGVLDGKDCTTHWMYTDILQRKFPQTRVYKDKLFVHAGNVYTSAGVTTGLDLALFMLEERHGASHAYAVARDLVVYIRRDGNEDQESVYLQYRQHISYPVHEVQDWIMHHLNDKLTLEDLSAHVHTTSRNLTRLFKSATGITVGYYIEKLRAEKAGRLLQDGLKIEEVARECGLKSTNQLRTLYKRHKGILPSGQRTERPQG